MEIALRRVEGNEKLCSRAACWPASLAVGTLVPGVTLASGRSHHQCRGSSSAAARVIESGTIVVRGGQIVSGHRRRGAIRRDCAVIDAKGMSAMPGFIDGHKHVQHGPNARRRRCSRCSRRATPLSSPAAGLADAQRRASRPASTRASSSARASFASGPGESPPDAGGSACGSPGAGRQGIKHTGEIGLTPEPRSAAVRDRSAQGDRGRGREGRRAGQRSCREQPGHGRGDRRRRDAVWCTSRTRTSPATRQAEKVAQTGAIVAGLIAFGAPNIDQRCLPAPAQVQWPKDNTRALP